MATVIPPWDGAIGLDIYREGAYTSGEDLVMQSYTPLGIALGGEGRLRAAIKAEVRQEHQAELAAATGYWQRVAIEEKIQREIKERMERVASPDSLWSCP